LYTAAVLAWLQLLLELLSLHHWPPGMRADVCACEHIDDRQQNVLVNCFHGRYQIASLRRRIQFRLR
jgi:hypothetical protein